jgi:hypothetical protein
MPHDREPGPYGVERQTVSTWPRNLRKRKQLISAWKLHMTGHLQRGRYHQTFVGGMDRSKRRRELIEDLLDWKYGARK